MPGIEAKPGSSGLGRSLGGLSVRKTSTVSDTAASRPSAHASVCVSDTGEARSVHRTVPPVSSVQMVLGPPPGLPARLPLDMALTAQGEAISGAIMA